MFEHNNEFKRVTEANDMAAVALVSNVGGFNYVCFNAFIDQEGYICSYGILNISKLEEEKWHKL